MAQYSIGQIEKISGVKSHILRYWEEVIPSITPKKEMSGRRVYSHKDLEIILRLKYLIYTRKFTIEGARNQIIQDAQNVQKNPDAVMAIREIRADLSELYFTLQSLRKQ
ncbi:MerR family transcriptional regulator [Treponema sp.]|uniref:MerR family transcriptional regulator n=1 Tax=Treponema sp. TaxID=166 RepID=UPI00389023B0